MKYGMMNVHPIPFDIPVAKIGTALSGKIISVLSKFPSEDKNLHPLQILWKYRLTNNGGEHFLTYMAESKFVIEDDGIPLVQAELDRFLGDIFLNVDLKWQELTRGTPLQGSKLPPLAGENLNTVRQQVLNYL